jgi:hypothetical protein
MFASNTGLMKKRGLTPLWFVLPICFLLDGCAHIGKGEAASGKKPEVTAVSDSLAELKREFNADLSKPRVLALFSPTCGGCIYGAKAMQHEAQRTPAVKQAKVLIVWTAMLESDNAREAQKAARQFDFEGAHHFYDGQRRIGARLMAEQFPTAIADALEILPRDHELRERLTARKDLPPEETPMWDAVLVFPAGVKWEDRSPTPIWWTKQTAYSGEEKPGELTATFWKRSTRQLPVRSDWYLEAREAWQAVAGASDGQSAK